MNILDTTSDSALVIAVGRFQDNALAELFRRHGAAVHNLARRVLRSRELADEVTQEVFVDLWNRPELFDVSRGSLRTFLVTKAHGKAVDLVRSESARKKREVKSAADQATAGYDIDRFAWDLAITDQVKNAVASLPDDERKAIQLAYFDGMTYREVAAALGAPEGTVKSRIRAGLKRLKGALVSQGVEAP